MSRPIAASARWSFELAEGFGHGDVTAYVDALVRGCGVTTGVVTVALVGSTGGVTTIEYEDGALADLRRAFDELAPAGGRYEHNARWHDGNGFSHLRSAMLKTSVAVPVIDGQLQLGTWQQIVVVNFDNRPRRREVVGVVVGSREWD